MSRFIVNYNFNFISINYSCCASYGNKPFPLPLGATPQFYYSNLFLGLGLRHFLGALPSTFTNQEHNKTSLKRMENDLPCMRSYWTNKHIHPSKTNYLCI